MQIAEVVRGNNYEPDQGTRYEARMTPKNCDVLCKNFAKQHNLGLASDGTLYVFSKNNIPLFACDKRNCAIYLLDT